MSRSAQRTNTRRPDMALVRQRRRAVLRRAVQTCAFLLFLGTAVSALLLLNSSFRINSWHIAGPEKLQRQIDTVMQSLPDYGFWSTRPGALSQQLMAAVADLESVEISRALPGSLQITATPRTPVGLWQKSNGIIWLVDAYGAAYRPLAQSEAADLPLLRISGSDTGEAADLMQQLQIAQPQFHARISELLSNGSSWQINFNRGQQWIIPRGRNVSYAINRIGELLAKPRWRTGHWRVDARIDTRWFIRPVRQEGVI